MTRSASQRSILRTSSISAAAQVVNVVSSIVRMKFAAILLGPAGVGLVGLYSNLLQTASALAALGTGGAGTRQIAFAAGSEADLAMRRARRALSWVTWAASGIGTVLFWLASPWLARIVLGTPGASTEIAWLAVGIGLSVGAGAQSALLTGMRRINDLALIGSASALLGSTLGVVAIWGWGMHGLVAMVLAGPLMSWLLGKARIWRLALAPAGSMALADTLRECASLVRLGTAFLVGGLASMLGQLAARILVERELGLGPLGQFQAAWTIGMTYLGFILAAMGTDYFPRLTERIRDRVEAANLVNEQTEVALYLFAPLLLVLLGFAPWLVRLLYSMQFSHAVEIVRWQVLGDVLKVMSWPLGFMLLAAGSARSFMLSETAAVAAFVGSILIGLPAIGVSSTGIAFVVMYLVYLPMVRWFVGRQMGFRWSRRVVGLASGLMVAAVAVDLAGVYRDWLGAVLGSSLGGLACMAAWRRLAVR